MKEFFGHYILGKPLIAGVVGSSISWIIANFSPFLGFVVLCSTVVGVIYHVLYKKRQSDTEAIIKEREQIKLVHDKLRLKNLEDNHRR